MYGTPVIASNIGGIPELIDDGKTGFLVAPSDSKALEEAIKKLDNEALLSRMKKNCKAKNFDDVEAYTQKLLTIYKN